MDKVPVTAEQERAAIVAFLRAGFDTYPHGTYARCREMQSYWDGAAEAIELGEHHKEGQ